MKRFEIKNNINGLQFGFESNELGPLQPEWGLPERPELGVNGQPTGKLLPAQFQIEITDLGKDLVYQASKLNNNRLSAYDIAGATDKARVDALWEWLVEQRPGLLLSLQPLRAVVKNKNPKPGEAPNSHPTTPPILPDFSKLIPNK